MYTLNTHCFGLEQAMMGLFYLTDVAVPLQANRQDSCWNPTYVTAVKPLSRLLISTDH